MSQLKRSNRPSDQRTRWEGKNWRRRRRQWRRKEVGEVRRKRNWREGRKVEERMSVNIISETIMSLMILNVDSERKVRRQFRENKYCGFRTYPCPQERCHRLIIDSSHYLFPPECQMIIWHRDRLIENRLACQHQQTRCGSTRAIAWTVSRFDHCENICP